MIVIGKLLSKWRVFCIFSDILIKLWLSDALFQENIRENLSFKVRTQENVQELLKVYKGYKRYKNR